MDRHATHDARALPFPPAPIFAVLADIENWNSWWPSEVRFRIVQLAPNLVGSKLEVKVLDRKFYAEVARVEPGKSIAWALRAAPYSGTGTWTLEQDEDRTLVTYASDLPPHPWIEGHFSDRKEFAAKHTSVIRRALTMLERRLGQA